MLFKVVVWLIVGVSLFASTNWAVSEALIGGRYTLELAITDSSETWPASISFELGDDGKVLQSDIDYPADECRGKIASLFRNADTLIIKEKIIEGKESCPPGEYRLKLDMKRVYASKRQSRFKSAEFLLEGENSPGRIIYFSLQPTQEGLYRLKHRNMGWYSLKQTSNIHAIEQYLKEVPNSSYRNEALKYLADLVNRSHDTSVMLHYAHFFADSPFRSQVLQALFKIAKTKHDWKLLSDIHEVRDGDYSNKASATAKEWLLAEPSIQNTVFYLQKFAPLDAGLIQAVKRTVSQSSEQSWDQLVSLYKKSPNPNLQESIVNRLMELSKQDCPSRRCWEIVMLAPESPEANSILAQFFMKQKIDTYKLDILSTAPTNAFSSLLKSLPKDIDAPVYLAIARSLYKYKNFTLGRQLFFHLNRFVEMQKNIDADTFLSKKIAPYYFAFAPDIKSVWKMHSPKHKLLLVLSLSDKSKPIKIDTGEICQKTSETKEVRTQTKVAFFIVPIGEEKARYLVGNYECTLSKQTISKLKQTFSLVASNKQNKLASIFEPSHQFSIEKKIETLSFKPNAIGEVMIEDANAPSTCKALRESCLARCVGLDDQERAVPLFGSTDQEKCESRCYSAFHACVKGK